MMRFGLFPFNGKLHQITVMSNGYPSVSCGKGKNKRTRYLHRLVMENRLLRKLRVGEIVHHRDENKLNFYPDNLTLNSSRREHVQHHNKKLREGRGEVVGVSKYCSRCERLRGVDRFYNQTSAYDGKQKYCKSCSKKYLQRWTSK